VHLLAICELMGSLISTAVFYAFALLGRILTHGMSRGHAGQKNKQGKGGEGSGTVMSNGSRPYAESSAHG
jgi:hypothetical protein